MGGDHGVTVTVPAALSALRRYNDLEVYLVGDEVEIREQLKRLDPGSEQDRIEVIHTPHVLTDRDKPARALRAREKSSMYITVELVRDGTANACVSAGNTGALLLTGRHLLKTLPGIDKPAIVATIPGASTPCLLLDVGANVDCEGAQLFEFAVMGTALAEGLGYSSCPTVGLLNIGVEDYKGNTQVREAAILLEDCPAINYVGYIEGNALYSSTADVVVCDGFVGNVTIKSSAGVVEVINGLLRSNMSESWLGRLSLFAAMPLIRKLQSRIDPAQYNGASLLGLQGSIIKSHGHAGTAGFLYAIERAIREADSNVPQLIANRVASIVTTACLPKAAVR